jgi:hypothetical protein
MCAAVIPLVGPPPALLAGLKPIFGHKMLHVFVGMRGSDDSGASPATLRAAYNILSPGRGDALLDPGSSSGKARTSQQRGSISESRPPALNDPPTTPKLAMRSSESRPIPSVEPTTPKLSGRTSVADSRAMETPTTPKLSQANPSTSTSTPAGSAAAVASAGAAAASSASARKDSASLSRASGKEGERRGSRSDQVLAAAAAASGEARLARTSAKDTSAAPAAGVAPASPPSVVSPPTVRVGVAGVSGSKTPGVVVISSGARRSNKEAVVGSGGRFEESREAPKEKALSPGPGRVVVATAPKKEEEEKWKALKLQMEERKVVSKKNDEALLEELDDFGRANPLFSPK